MTREEMLDELSVLYERFNSGMGWRDGNYEEALNMAIEMLEDDDRNSSEKPNNCETCKHNKLEWYSEVCDGCSKAHSHYEPKTERRE